MMVFHSRRFVIAAVAGAGLIAGLAAAGKTPGYALARTATPVLATRVSGPQRIEVNDSAIFAIVDAGDMDVARVSWSFGDGSFALAGMSVAHTYSMPGTYVVRVAVLGDDGAEVIRTFTVTVTDSSGSDS